MGGSQGVLDEQGSVGHGGLWLQWEDVGHLGHWTMAGVTRASLGTRGWGAL